MNVSGEEVFEGDQNLFNTLIGIRDNLRSGDTDSMRNNLSTLDDMVGKIYNIQSAIGAKINRVDSADTRAGNDLTNFKNLLSGIESTDSNAAIVNYQQELNYLQSTLEAGSRLLNMGLEQFLQ